MDKILAQKELIRQQIDQGICVKACDYGAGIVLPEFTPYKRACYEHLTSDKANGTPYYSKVHDLAEEKSKTKIRDILQEMLDKNVISKTEIDAMNTDAKTPGRCYSNLKYNSHTDMEKQPLVRPIIGEAVGTLTPQGLRVCICYVVIV